MRACVRVCVQNSVQTPFFKRQTDILKRKNGMKWKKSNNLATLHKLACFRALAVIYVSVFDVGFQLQESKGRVAAVEEVTA